MNKILMYNQVRRIPSLYCLVQNVYLTHLDVGAFVFLSL